MSLTGCANKHIRTKKLRSGRSSSPRAKELVALIAYDLPLPEQIYTITLENKLSSKGEYLLLPTKKSQQLGLQINPQKVQCVEGVPITIECHSVTPCHVPAAYPLVQALLLPLKLEQQPQIALVSQQIDKAQPLRTYCVDGVYIQGLLDTGADCSVIPPKQWQAKWTTKPSPAVWGVGGASTSLQSIQPLRVTTTEGKEVGFITPLCVDIDVALWGRDLLSTIGATLQLDE